MESTHRRGMLRPHVVVVPCFWLVRLPTVGASEDWLLYLGRLLPTSLLVVLVAHQAGESSHAALRKWKQEAVEGRSVAGTPTTTTKPILIPLSSAPYLSTSLLVRRIGWPQGLFVSEASLWISFTILERESLLQPLPVQSLVLLK